MSIFKSKKTYIKRYSSKNSDKKITFAPSVKSTFSVPVSEIKTTAKAEKTVKEPTRPQGPNGTIRFAHDSEYKKSFTDKKPQYTKAAVVSGPAVRRPAPIEKPDLTGVKAEGKVRPILDDKVDFSQPIEPEFNEPFKIPEPKKVQPTVTGFKETEKELTSSEKSKIKKKNKEIKKELKRATKAKKIGFSFGDVFAIVVKSTLLLAVVAGIGFAGYKFITADSPQPVQQEVMSEPVMYAPQDYTAPEIPEDITAANAAARQEAERIAAANAYVPSRYEVPNLYKYDYVKTCYLTFDDGPSADVTGRVLDILKQYDVKATFFVVGQNAESYPDLIKRMEAEGHSIGNHSYSHNYDYLYSDDDSFDSEMNSCQNAINNILGKDYPNKIFRFPGGMFGQPASWYTYNINSEGYQYINWNSLTGDSAGEVENPDSEYLMNELKESTNNGRTEDIVVLMHDAGAKQVTADTLPQVIEYLKSKNYVFKPIYNSYYTPQ